MSKSNNHDDGTVGIGELLVEQARRDPSAKALTAFTTPDPVGPIRSRTRIEFARDVIGVARSLERAGIGTTDRLALLLPTIPEYHSMLWGGASVCSVLPLNPLLRLDHVEHLLRSSETSTLAFPTESLDAGLWKVGQEILKRIPDLRALEIGTNSEFSRMVQEYASMEAPARRLSVDPAILFHTGGTTGRPKLAVLTLANVVAAITMLEPVLEYSASDTLVSSFPLFHIAGAVVVGLAPLLAGAHLVMPAPQGLRDREVVKGFWRLLERTGATIMSAAPTSLAALSQVPVDGDLGELNFVLTGSSSLPAETARRFTNLTGKTIHTGYGMTETTGVIAYVPRRLEAMPATVGPPLPDQEIKIEPLSSSQNQSRSGRVIVRGPNVFQGYLGENVSPLDPDGWLDTGDLGFLDIRGWLTLTGRSKDLIIRGGHNIDPAVIEEAAAAHPLVSLAAAVGGIDAYAGEVPVLFVELKSRAQREIVLSELEALLARTIAEPPARPREIYAVERLPLTAVGKVFKPALRADAARRRLLEMLQARNMTASNVALDISVEPSGRLSVSLQTRDVPAETLDEICREIRLFDVDLICNDMTRVDDQIVVEEESVGHGAEHSGATS